MHARALGSLTEGRENNLNLVRMAAALAVAVSHAWPLTRGQGAEQPLQTVLGMPLGTLAVYTFFLVSGLLISQSFDRRRSLFDFVLARALRILPALAVVLVLTVLVLGPAVTALPLTEYFASPGTLGYAPRNLSLAFPQYGLPGVFLGNPYPEAVNGSLWSLFHEVVCYGGVVAAGLLGLRLRRFGTAALVALYAAAYLAVELGARGMHLHPKLIQLQEVSLPFFIGMLAWRFRDRIRLDLGLFVVACASAAAMAATTVVREVFIVVWGYIVLYLAYAPKTPLLAYNRLGDFSYGFYILAFPMQQLVVHLGLANTPYTNMAWAIPPALLLAVLSWRTIEKPMIAARAPLAARLRALPTPKPSSIDAKG